MLYPMLRCVTKTVQQNLRANIKITCINSCRTSLQKWSLTYSANSSETPHQFGSLVSWKASVSIAGVFSGLLEGERPQRHFTRDRFPVASVGGCGCYCQKTCVHHLVKIHVASISAVTFQSLPPTYIWSLIANCSAFALVFSTLLQWHFCVLQCLSRIPKLAQHIVIWTI